MIKSIFKLFGYLIFLAFVYLVFDYHQVPESKGDSVAARPLPEQFEPVNPNLIEPQRSSMHAGAYNRDVNSFPGPLGVNSIGTHRSFSSLIGVAPNISFDLEGRLVTVSIQYGKIELHLLDPITLESLAVYELPEKASFDDNSGGGYFHLDSEGRPILAPSDNSIKVFEVIEENDIYLGNMFSPNYDGNNDYFYIQSSSRNNIDVEAFSIYDRWGNQVFHKVSPEINNEADGWDGTKNGEQLSIGVYAFIIIYNVNETEEIYTGHVTLVK